MSHDRRFWTSERLGISLLAVPILGWLAYGIYLCGWVVPVLTYVFVGFIVAGVTLLIRSDRRS